MVRFRGRKLFWDLIIMVLFDVRFPHTQSLLPFVFVDKRLNTKFEVLDTRKSGRKVRTFRLRTVCDKCWHYRYFGRRKGTEATHWKAEPTQATISFCILWPKERPLQIHVSHTQSAPRKLKLPRHPAKHPCYTNRLHATKQPNSRKSSSSHKKILPISPREAL